MLCSRNDTKIDTQQSSNEYKISLQNATQQKDIQQNAIHQDEK
jgi:hypothetical protein